MLYETVYKALYLNAAFPIPSEELLRKIQCLSNNYEAKILENLRRLSVASMRDLLAFLRKDALSLDKIRAKIDTGGCQNSDKQRQREDLFCFHHLSRWSFDKIQSELTKPTDASEQNFRHLSATTVKIFLEVELLFQEYVQACSGIFNMTDEIGEILRNDIRSLYNLKKSEMLYNELYRDPWYLAARASEGTWSTVLYSILLPHTMQFSPERMKDFMNSVTNEFNDCVDRATTNDEGLRESIKQQFRDNCAEYLLRGIYAYRDIPSPEKNALVNAIFEYARKMFEGSESQPPK